MTKLNFAIRLRTWRIADGQSLGAASPDGTGRDGTQHEASGDLTRDFGAEFEGERHYLSEIGSSAQIVPHASQHTSPSSVRDS